MYILANLRRHRLAIGLSLGTLTIVYPPQAFGAPKACLSPDVETRLKQRDTALLGPDHAAHHAEARARQCRVAKGLEKVARPDAQVLAAAAAQPTSAIGQWSASFTIPVAGITSVLLNNGKVLFWAYDPAHYLVPTASNTGVAAIWNPATKTGYSIPAPENIWCGGQTILSDGRVYLAGGNLRYPDPNANPSGWEGSFSNYTFNPNNETWTKQPDMTSGRWYPTATQQADNKVVITSGFDQSGTQAVTQTVDLFTPAAAIDGVGTVMRLPDHDPTGLYPFQYLMPSGKMLQAGPSYTNSSLLTPGTWTWSPIPNINMLSSHYGYTNGIIYTDASGTPIKQIIMIAGGENGVTVISNNEWLDSTNPTVGWKQYPQWLQARHNGNTVILPDGTLFTVGGNSATTTYDGALFESELFNKPADDRTGQWVQMAPNTIRAAYHSSAILLPDATVLLSEDDIDYPQRFTRQVQIYSPPYLFKGSRPQITSAPSAVSRGQSFSVRADTPKIVSVMLIAPGAVTYGNDMHQRGVKLPFKNSGPNLTVTIPNSSSLVPPGWYMLFIVDQNGIPSVAKFARVS